ncbi:Mbeg1-like protein [Lactobacillus selangorensis]|nr:Mbeg1-like protein [Lactobacillus selangorensis]
MASIVDYVNQNGQYSFSERPFNDVDGTILAQLAYVDFSLLNKKHIHKLAQLTPELIQKSTVHTWNPAGNQALLKAAQLSQRFGQLKWDNYAQKIDPKLEQQFSAITFTIAPDTYYIAYRGTTATLVDWKEDFNMTFMDAVPSQRAATHYFQKQSLKQPGYYYLGGHSKGGNLAFYAAAHSQTQAIKGVYSIDGPGLKKPLPEELQTRAHKLIPDASIIGLLLEPETNYTVVKSDGQGIRQHDPYTWLVKNNHFEVIASVSRFSQFTQASISTWLAGMDDATKQEFLDSVFALVSADGEKHFSELGKEWPQTLQMIAAGIAATDDQTRRHWLDITGQLGDVVTHQARKLLKKEFDHYKNIFPDK